MSRSEIPLPHVTNLGYGVTVTIERHRKDRRFIVAVVRDDDQILREWSDGWDSFQSACEFAGGYRMAKLVWKGTTTPDAIVRFLRIRADGTKIGSLASAADAIEKEFTP